MIDPDLLSMLRCPVCKGTLAIADERLLCEGCGRTYAINDGIPALAPDLALEE